MKTCYCLSILTKLNLAEFLNGTSNKGYFTRIYNFGKIKSLSFKKNTLLPGKSGSLKIHLL